MNHEHSGQNLPMPQVISSINEMFLAAFRDGQEPQIEDYLVLGDDRQSLLLSVLLKTELECRGERGEHPSIDEYHIRFPSFADTVSRVFTSSVADDTVANEWERQDQGKPQLPISGLGDEIDPQVTKVGQFGDYELLQEIARGGMGVVFRARQIKANRLVAIKMILSGKLATDEQIKRFYSEAEAAANLDHPNIVPIYDVGEHDGQHFFSMPFVDGQSLKDKLANGPMNSRESLEILLTVTKAVAFAHSQGVIHRDLKPANVLLDKQLVPRVTDFGLAKRIEADSDLTASGQVMGTPNYMPPEQAMGKTDEIGRTADVYSLGALLYDMLTGHAPFQAPSSIEVLKQVVEQEPIPPRNLNPSIHRDVETICLKCLRKEPAKRYQTASDLAEDIQRFLSGHAILARPAGAAERTWRWCKRNQLVAVLSLAVLVTLIAGTFAASYFAVQAKEESKQAKTNELAAVEESERAKEAEQAERDLRSIAEDRLVRIQVGNGSRLMDDNDLTRASIWFIEALKTDQGKADKELIHRIRMSSLLDQTPQLVQMFHHPMTCNRCEFSRDGKKLVAAYGDRERRSGEVRIWNVESGSSLTLAHSNVVTHVGFSTDGNSIVTTTGPYGAKAGIARVWDVETGVPISPELKHDWPLYHASFHPDGTTIVTSGGEPYKGRATVWDIKTGKQHFDPLQHPASVNHAEFSSDGKKIAAASGYGTFAGDVRIWSAATGTPITAPLKHGDSGATYLTFNQDGTKIASAGSDGSLRIWDTVTGLSLTSFAESVRRKHQLNHVEFSPDEKLVLACSGMFRLGDGEAQVWDLESGRPVAPAMIHTRKGINIGKFLDDGKTVLTAGSDGRIQFWDTYTAKKKYSTLFNGQDAITDVSMNQSLLAVGSHDGTIRIWDLQARQPSQRLLSNRDKLRGAIFSEDGKQIAAIGSDQVVRVWNTENGARVGSDMNIGWYVGHLAFDRQGVNIVVAGGDGYDGKAQVWNVDTCKALTGELKHEARVEQAVFSPDGQAVLTGCGYGDVKQGDASVWNIKTGQRMVGPLKHEHKGVACVAYSNDGKKIATGGYDGRINVWNADEGNLLHSFALPSRSSMNWVVTLAFDETSRLVAGAGMNQMARVWDVESGKATSPHLEHDGGIGGVQFHPVGKSKMFILTSSGDATARLWEMETGELVVPPLEHGASVTSAAFSQDQRFIVTTASDKTARIWDAMTGDPITPKMYHHFPVQSFWLNPEANRLITYCFDSETKEGEIVSWNIKENDWPVEKLETQIELLSGHRLHRSGTLVPMRITKELWNKADD